MRDKRRQQNDAAKRYQPESDAACDQRPGKHLIALLL